MMLVYIHALESTYKKAPKLEYYTILKKNLYVSLEEIFGLPLKRHMDFLIELMP